MWKKHGNPPGLKPVLEESFHIYENTYLVWVGRKEIKE